MLCSLSLVLTATAQTITADIQSISAPTGTLASPRYVVDSDGNNPAAGYTREAMTVTTSVRFTKNTADATAQGDFRLSAQLIDVETGLPVTLEAGLNVAPGTSQTITVSNAAPTATVNLSTSVDPGVDLGAGKAYLMRVTVQRLGTLTLPGGGGSLPIWLTADGPEDSGAFRVIHFTDAAAGAERWVRGYATGVTSWTRSYRMATDPAKNRFHATVPYFMARYDLGGTTTSIPFRITATVTDDTGANVPLVNGGVTTLNVSMAATVVGIPAQPSTSTGTFTATFAPVNQLDSRGRTYKVRLAIEHQENPPLVYHSDGETGDTPLSRLMDFNGTLRFSGVAAQINTLANNPIATSLGADFVNTTIQVSAGSVPGRPYTFGSSASLGVRLETDGDAVVVSGSETIAQTPEATYGGVKVTYPSTWLSASGATAGSAILHLPQGLGMTPNRATSNNRYRSSINFGSTLPLTSSFRHTGALSLGFGSNAWVFDEARPMLYQASDVTFETSGEMRFKSVAAEWAHVAAFSRLETNQATGLHESPEMSYRLTNDGVLRFAKILSASDTVFTAASDGSARTKEAGLEIADGSFHTHFPRGAEVKWDGGGAGKIADGVFGPGSELADVKTVKLNYDGSCTDDACGPAGGAVDGVAGITQSGRMLITPDGGLHALSDLDPLTLKWGIKGDGAGGSGPHTHRSDKFETGDFFMPGHQLYDAENALMKSPAFAAKGAVLAPGALLLAGYDSSSQKSVQPETPEYRKGTGAYAGYTMTVEKPSEGASQIADMTSEYRYDLQEQVTKYYVRSSGISGRHVAMEGGFDPEVVMYGYPFRLNLFQLTYLSNENEDSWINGEVTVPYPSDFTLLFSNLMLSCSGALEQATLDPKDDGAKTLAYWNGSFKPMAMDFRPPVGASCYSERFLTLGLVTGAANITTPLAGTLAFRPNGNIATLADQIVGADGRLGLPGKVYMKGPGNERYPLYPVNKLYFNNPNISGAPSSGYVNFAATCNVPFFEDLKVHCMTSAQADIPAPLYIAGGWTGGGDTFFTNTKFDETHRGFPVSGIAVGDYQNPGSQTSFVVNASQSIFGLVPLNYPLRWNASSRFFTSWGPSKNDLLVVNVEHQVDYLSAENAELSFGAQYDGLPQINLVSTAYDAVEEQLGAARALTDAASQFVTDTLNEGVDQIGQLASDNVELLLDETLGRIEGEVIDPLYEAVVDSYQDAVAANEQYGDWVNASSGDLKVVFDRYLDGSIGAPAESIKGRLDDLADAATSASNLVGRVDKALLRGILAIDSVTGEIRTFRNGGSVVVDLTAPPGYSPDKVINGILKKVAGPGGTQERQIVQALVRVLISELAPDDIASVLEPLLNDLSSELNGELNELLHEFDPTLDRVTEALLEARGYLVTLRSKLQVGQELITNFQQIVAGASAEITAIINGIRATTYDFIDRMAAGATYLPNTVLGTAGNLLHEFDKEEFMAMIRAELRDRLLGAGFIQQIQYTLRQYISELDLAMKSAIDSAFAEVNRMCKELIKEALGPIDDAINGLIGDVNAFLGAGSIDGYAHIQGDTLRKLRLDAEVQFKIPEEMKLHAFFEMNCYDSRSDGGGCVGPGEMQVEVKIGALDVPLDWVSPDVRADLEVRFTMQTAPVIKPIGVGGSLAMTSGEINFQSIKITEFAASVGVGIQECYLAATARVEISSYEAAGGIFFGRTCTLAPLLLVDPDVGDLLGTPPFTGAYVYGEVWIPISEVVLGIPASCFFRISAGVGAGAFYFVEGPTFGGKMLLGVSGEALCVVSIKGQVKMTGVMNGGSLRFRGKGTLSGKAGWCPFCVEFSESATVTYQDGSWSVDL
ncbi:hypothetical protein OKA04_18870 [Luteolibacter flavescens]|uniref:Uncharacterized protein n=1 Tax=Luteolibacter flavescens TaxID=1859460 RepID=A0ABT3FV05_9BACT|nr:hypothetical protein [Luteolibacter flavescens]MCW1886810.1 hypothetical protein [Luteolibacter flavescens]